MIRYVMNDYELIYLIQCQHDHIAFDYLFKKYERFIWKQVHLIVSNPEEHDDFFQEGVLMLLKATQTYDPNRRKTFMRYFELILKRKFYQLITKLPHYEINEMACMFQIAESDGNYELPDLEFQSKLEQDVHNLHLIQGMKIKAVSELIGVDVKAIYNAIYRIKEKYKNVL